MKSFIYLATLTASIAVMIPSYAFDQSSPANSLVVDVNGDIGVGTATPGKAMEISRPGATSQIEFKDSSTSHSWVLGQGTGNIFSITDKDPTSSAEFKFTKTGTMVFTEAGGVNSFIVNSAGNMIIPGTLIEGSNVDSKEAFKPVNTKSILDKISKLPISTWSYKSDKGAYRHLGPMSQDFHREFNIGYDDKHISSLDTSGVALAGIQELTKQSREKDLATQSLIQRLQAKIETLEARLNRN